MRNICVQGVHDGGLYKHYKGGVYQVVGFAVDTSTGGWLVLYRVVLPDGASSEADHPYARAVEEWFQTVDAEGTARFTEVRGG